MKTYIFNSKQDVETWVNSQPIEYGEHDNPTADELIEMIVTAKSFQYGKDCESIVNYIWESVIISAPELE